MISADVGVATPLELMLFDGNETKGVRVRIRTTAGLTITTVNLAHVGDGLYTGLWTPSTTGFFHAIYFVYTDMTYVQEDVLYQRTTEVYKVINAANDVSHAVWDALMGEFEVVGSFGYQFAQFLASFDPEILSSIVWDAPLAQHILPGTFGICAQSTWDYTRTIAEQVGHPIWGLGMLHAQIQDSTALIDGHVVDNGIAISQIIPALNLAETHILGAISSTDTLITNLAIQGTADKGELLDAFNHTDSLISDVSNLVQTLTNNTTARFVVPERLVKPATGSKDYQFHLRVYDNSGAPEAPDATPTIRIRRLDSGSDIVSGAPMTQDGIKVGAYYYTYSVTSSSPEFPALVEVSIIEGGVTRFIPSVTEVTEFESDLNAIQAQLTTVGSKVDTTNSHLTNASYGLAALKIGEGDILSAIAAEAVTLSQIKARTDLIPNDIAVGTDIDAVMSALGQLPLMSTINTAISNARDAIMGPDGHSISDVYDKWDTSDLLKVNDPRLANLDAKISTRSVLTAPQIWHYAERTLTDSVLTESSVKAIWDYLYSSNTPSGSILGLIRDNLDAKVSTRATTSQVTAELDGVAKESTSNAIYGSLDTKYSDLVTKLANITAKTLAIQAKTSLIPSAPASENTLSSGVSAIRSDLINIDNLIDIIRERTDRIPNDVALQSTLLQIPKNPLLTNDGRLINLDARISTRSTLTTDDLQALATASELLSTKNMMMDGIGDVIDLVGSLGALTNLIKGRTDKIPNDPATLAALSSAQSAILAAIGNISVGAGSTPSQIWSYANRTLTQDPATFGPDISNLATKDDVAAISVEASSQYANRMTTTFNPSSGIQEVLVWAEKNGHPVNDSSDCTILVKDAAGITKWTQTSSQPNSDGVYRFINPIVVTSDSNYYITMVIKVEDEFKVSQQAFITVG